MRTTSATQTPRTPQSPCDGRGEHGGADDERDAIDAAMYGPSLGADQDPVEREHGAVERLHEREDRPQQRALLEHGGVVAEHAGQHVRRARAGRRRTARRPRRRGRSCGRSRRTPARSRPPPSSRPTMIWPAIAIASSTSARKIQSWKEIWYAAELRVAEACDDRAREDEDGDQRRRADEDELPDREQPRAQARRRGARSSRPTWRRISQHEARRPCTSARSRSPRPIPRSPSRARRRTRSSSTTLSSVAGDHDHERACAGPRRRAGIPGRRARGRRTAGRARRSADTCGLVGRLPLDPDDRDDRAGEERDRRAARTTPMPSESQSDCAPSCRATVVLARPVARATCAVVPYWRKLNIASTASAVAAAPSAASCGGRDGRRSPCRRGCRAARPRARPAPEARGAGSGRRTAT